MKPVQVVRRVSAVLSLVMAASSAFGQGVPVLKKGNFEIGAFGGSTFGSGIGQLNTQINGRPYATPPSNGAIGTHFGLAASSHVVVYGEWAYLVGSRAEANQDLYLTNGTGSRASVDGHLNAMDVNGGLEYRFQPKKSPKLVPYFLAGVGGIRSSVDFSQSQIGTTKGSAFTSSIHQTSLVGTAGGGVRFFFTEHAGLRVELKGYEGQHSVHFGRLAFGLFYQFR